MRKYDVAVQLRDAAFDMLSRQGRLQEIAGGLKAVVLEFGSLQLMMTTPFQKMSGPKAPESYDEAVWHSKYKEPPPYCIDVWAGQKVFSVAWGGGDPLTVISFKRGTWEGELMSVSNGAGKAEP